ncbi:MAG: hypothetical protein U0694_04360 [Anaerolineae bacterium]
MMQITLNISEEVYQRNYWIAHWTGRDIADVLADSINYPLPKLNPQVYPPVEQLTDEAVLALAKSLMADEQGERITDLADKQQRGVLTESERAELAALTEIYQVGLLRKAQGLREAVERGLMKRLDE